MPPASTAGTAPIRAASAPDSNSPSSFEAPMNTALTAETRPRMSSGVSICTRVWRTNTLTMSAAPSTSRQSSDNGRLVDNPKPMVATPNSATAWNIRRPVRRRSGRCARKTAIATAPAAGMLRSRPRPHGPTNRMSRA